jgi:hypothetical protein
MGCNASCHDRGATTCNCDNICDRSCTSIPGPTYNACVSTVFQWCKDNCEKGCKGEKVNNWILVLYVIHVAAWSNNVWGYIYAFVWVLYLICCTA